MRPRRRLPNPWIAIPGLAAGALAAALGWIITDISCRPGSCPALAVTAAAVGFLAGALGMAVVLVLVFRSIAEWKSDSGEGTEKPSHEPGSIASPATSPIETSRVEDLGRGQLGGDTNGPPTLQQRPHRQAGLSSPGQSDDGAAGGEDDQGHG